MKPPKTLLFLLVAMLTQMLQSCDPFLPMENPIGRIKTGLFNLKSDSVRVQLDVERFFYVSNLFTYNFTLMSGEQYSLQDEIPSYQDGFFHFNYYITDVHGKIDTVKREVDVKRNEYRRNISEIIYIKD